jgi:hypothetical protein
MNYVLVEHHLALDAVEELVIAAPMVNNLRFVYHKMILLSLFTTDALLSKHKKQTYATLIQGYKVQ